jgi:hypothetical protein
MDIPTLDFTDKKNTHLKDIDIKSKSVDSVIGIVIESRSVIKTTFSPTAEV